MVAVALQTAGSAERVASTNPALSFMARDQRMFGPAGLYRPLPWASTCVELATELARQGATVAILDGTKADPVLQTDSEECPLKLVTAADDPVEERRISVFARK